LSPPRTASFSGTASAARSGATRRRRRSSRATRGAAASLPRAESDDRRVGSEGGDRSVVFDSEETALAPLVASISRAARSRDRPVLGSPRSFPDRRTSMRSL
jgi:hypothetical protein